MRLADVAWPDVEELDSDLAVLPVGSIEQHGPHGPLGTDTLAAEAVAEAGADAYDGDVLVAPAVPVGISEEHRHFAGSLWVSPETFRSYVGDVVRSLAHHGFERIVLVNGHGGNVGALREVAADLSRGGVAFTVPFTWFDAVDAPDMGHGGPVETALVRHVAPELVREDRLEEAAAGASEGWGDWLHGVNLAYDAAEFSESGAVGDPHDGDAERGAALLDEAADALADVLAAVETREWPASDGPSSE